MPRDVARGMDSVVRDITEHTFSTDVIEHSRRRPVVVDFWAPWCGPCHHLSPLLERVAQRFAGDVDVVKLNVDEAPGIAAQFRVQGIPAVKAFKDGKVAGEFVGVQPEQVIERLFAAVAPTEADRLVEQAAGAADPATAEQLLREALASDRTHARGIVALARLLAADGRGDEAQQLLERIPNDPEARKVLAMLRLGDGGDVDIDALRAQAEAGDAGAALRLGRALAAQQDHHAALPLLVAAARDADTRDDARATAVSIFEVRGPDDELVRTWRPRLAAALF